MKWPFKNFQFYSSKHKIGWMNEVAAQDGGICLEFLSFLSVGPRNPYWSGRISRVDLLVLTNLDQLIFILNILFTFFHKTSYLNEKSKCTEPSLPVSVPWMSNFHAHTYLSNNHHTDTYLMTLRIPTLTINRLIIMILNLMTLSIPALS